MSQEIIFDTTISDSDTFLIGYLRYFEKWSFEEFVARLYSLSNQNIFNNGDNYKISFCAYIKYGDTIFTLYDYKTDYYVHIGSDSYKSLKLLPDFEKKLYKLLENVEPKDFNAEFHYDEYKGKKYSYPTENPKQLNSNEIKIFEFTVKSTNSLIESNLI
jgi:hypothetical protein